MGNIYCLPVQLSTSTSCANQLLPTMPWLEGNTRGRDLRVDDTPSSQCYIVWVRAAGAWFCAAGIVD